MHGRKYKEEVDQWQLSGEMDHLGELRPGSKIVAIIGTIF